MKDNLNTIQWFKNIPNKKTSSFVDFDVENFHLSISVKLLTDSVNYLKSLIDITDIIDEEYSTIIYSRKILYFQNSKPWAKKDGNEDFDVSVGCYDGAEIHDLVGSFIFNQLGPLIEKNGTGLYRDNVLRSFSGISKPMIEKKKKLIAETFKHCYSPSPLNVI